ncbi:MAG: hypothetical protein IPL49_20835 [Saprospirales bacterium]|nr:hypothetical protein [Saprospirales bacterium]MBK8493256.1 hypothetical protein [Saprospirales bacterium]
MISYEGTAYCTSLGTPQAVTLTGTVAGVQPSAYYTVVELINGQTVLLEGGVTLIR